ncbi:uncharacterized protein LOC127795524 [Diospyros lotus]|uniref:uncharacterized protein LOC127795524 n=1 Tax=Diospyros lotus TaxID=55363 RepID=UPI0022587652|nr:uncharacterized protein LOC127795524 [Diospyros lotus]
MATTDEEHQPVVFYAAIPQNSPDHDHQDYVVLPLYPHRRRPGLPPDRRHCLRRSIFFSAAALLLAAAIFLLYPSDPKLTVVRLRLNRVQLRTSPHLSLDLSLSVTLRVRNLDFFSLDYSSLAVAVGYRGRELGFVTSQGGRIRARGSSYVDADMVLDGFEVIHDAIYLVEDWARGSIPFDTESVVKGTVGVFFLEVPVQARISCQVYVNTKNQTITHQDCGPDEGWL